MSRSEPGEGLPDWSILGRVTDRFASDGSSQGLKASGKVLHLRREESKKQIKKRLWLTVSMSCPGVPSKGMSGCLAACPILWSVCPPVYKHLADSPASLEWAAETATS